MLSKVGKGFLFRKLFSWRKAFQGRHLLLTNTLAAGSLMGLGDILQQSREIHKKPSKVRDWRRTGRMFVVGCSLGTMLHKWFTWLERIYPGNTLKVVGTKILLDQVLASPITAVWYFIALNLLEGNTLSKGLEEVKDKFWELYKADCSVWPAAQMINFYFLPPKHRVLYVSSVSLGWDVYLSYLKNQK